jgi:hypothetical protein
MASIIISSYTLTVVRSHSILTCIQLLVDSPQLSDTINVVKNLELESGENPELCRNGKPIYLDKSDYSFFESPEQERI